MSSPKKLHAEISITGMTCASCELVLERKLKAVPGVLHVDVQYKKNRAIITAYDDALPSAKKIEQVILKAGYNTSTIEGNRNWLEIGASFLIIFALYKLLQTFDVFSLAPSVSGALSFSGILIIGLVAGMSSCLAVTGGLLLALAAKHNEIHQKKSSWHKLKPLLHFNIGRLVSYFVLGGLIGILGQSIILSPKISGYMSIAVAFIMLWLALTILQIIPKGSFPIRPPKKLSRWIHDLSESEHPAAAFTLGGMTFFLPCGFTQSLQLVALASGSFLTGALTMFLFAFGTLPSLLGLSAIASAATGTFSRLFLRFSGALVLILALFNLQNGFVLTGIALPNVFAQSNSQARNAAALPKVENGMQTVTMKVTSSGYEPQNLTIKSGVPVRWTIDGAGVQGCTRQLVIPSLGISKQLTRGQNIIEFTAPNRGQLAFSCSMGMVHGSFTVL
jgi:sulfite exporter TauE/SafE/copper chaperone CopZ